MPDSIPTKSSIGNTVRLLLFPGLVSLLSILIWRGVVRLQNDVSQLLADNNTQKIQIDYLERQVNNLNKKVYNISYIDHPFKKDNKVNDNVSNEYISLVGTKTEIFDINDYIKHG